MILKVCNLINDSVLISGMKQMTPVIALLSEILSSALTKLMKLLLIMYHDSDVMHVKFGQSGLGSS